MSEDIHHSGMGFLLSRMIGSLLSPSEIVVLRSEGVVTALAKQPAVKAICGQFKMAEPLTTEHAAGAQAPVADPRLRGRRPRPPRGQRRGHGRSHRQLIEQAFHDGYKPTGMAVLVLLYAQTPFIEHALIERRIPYRIVGSTPFYQRPEVVTLLCYLRLGLLERQLQGGCPLTDEQVAECGGHWERVQAALGVRAPRRENGDGGDGRSLLAGGFLRCPLCAAEGRDVQLMLWSSTEHSLAGGRRQTRRQAEQSGAPWAGPSCEGYSISEERVLVHIRHYLEACANRLSAAERAAYGPPERPALQRRPSEDPDALRRQIAQTHELRARYQDLAAYGNMTAELAERLAGLGERRRSQVTAALAAPPTRAEVSLPTRTRRCYFWRMGKRQASRSGTYCGS